MSLWIAIPCFVLPAGVFVHLLVAYRLASRRTVRSRRFPKAP